MSPFYLLYGRLPNLPIDVKLQQNGEKISLNQYREFINNEWKTIREQAQINNKESKDKQTQIHDRKRKIRIFEIGQKVLREIPNRFNKLDPRYECPYEIADKISDATYTIKIDDTNNTQVHASQLKQYQKRDSTKQKNIRSNRGKNPRINLITTLWIAAFLSLAMGQGFGSKLVWRTTDHKLLKGRAKLNYTIEVQNPCYLNHSDEALKVKDLNINAVAGICNPYIAPLPGKTISYWQCSSLLKRYRKKQWEAFNTNCSVDLAPCGHLEHTTEDIKMIGLDYCDYYIRNELDPEFNNFQIQKNRRK